jgi:hypothetical protein
MGNYRYGQPQPYDAQGDLIGEFGELDQMSVLIQLLQNNPQLAQLYQQSQQGFSPMVQGQLGQMGDIQQQMLGGGFFGDEQRRTFEDMISGKTLRGQGGTIYDMIERQFAGSRDQARAQAASLGLQPTSGAAQSLTGQVAGAQEQSFADQMVKQYLNMVGLGTQGLGQMGGEQLQRQQGAAGIGQFLTQFGEQSAQNRMQLGAQITQQQMAPLLQLLQMHSQKRMEPTGMENVLGAFGELAPMALSAIFPPAAAAGAVSGPEWGTFLEGIATS